MCIRDSINAEYGEKRTDMEVVLSPPRGGMGSLRIEEIELIHQNITASIVAAHGVHAAARVLTRSLEWLIHQQRPTQPPQPPQPHPANESEATMRQNKHNLMSSLGWEQQGSGEWLKGPDPWRGLSWNLFPVRRGIRKRWLPDKWVECSVSVQVEPTPFTRGAMRECFRMKSISESGQDVNWVAKRFLSTALGVPECEAGIKMQMRAKEHCRAFNSFRPPKPVDILACFMVQLQDPEESYACEPLLVGDYVKYNSVNLQPRHA
eukprot:TRINITY_DN3919_c0_g2_i7.p1 TRINITY_DN3919_c0_g2~~TRINITY_DN3919_c0_g2_i7.p1  ORF type:complete len:263 (-),score=24.41 TRINITY_DN3919_c0_g2_i7:120-908(-)